MEIPKETTKQNAGCDIKKYKVAIMGISGVGKTTFFASYFYRTIRKALEEPLSIIATQSSEPKIEEMIEMLFKEQFTGSKDRIKIDFNVDNLDKQSIEVILDDLPGGFTNDVRLWDQKEITKDLKTADGIIFFVSAQDLWYDQKKFEKDNNNPFSVAVNKIRTDGESGERADVPIWFLFTKCDAIPDNVSAEDLVKKAPKLIIDAKTKHEDLFFPKGRNVKYYKVSAMGKWKDSQTPPAEEFYEPLNVVESMEDFLRAMHESKTRHSKMRFVRQALRLLTKAAALFATIIALWCGFDYYRWDKALKTIEAAVTNSQWEDAQKAVESFSGRWLPPLLPVIYQTDINTLYERYEKAMYSKVLPDITGVDINKIPLSYPSFLASALRVRHYLAQPEFYEANQQNYENVRKFEPYYEVAQMLLSTTKELIESESPQDFINFIQTNLTHISTFPIWRNDLTVRIDEAVRMWAMHISGGAVIEDLRKAISDAEQLASHPNMAIELKDFLHKQKAQFDHGMKVAWEKRCNEWLQEATQERDFDSAIQLLIFYQNTPHLPEEQRTRLIRALNQRYEAIVNNAIATGDEGELQDIKRQYSALPYEQIAKIDQRLQTLNIERYARLVGKINEARSIDELLSEAEETQDAQSRFPEISREVLMALSRVVDKEIDDERYNWGKDASDGEFARAKQNMDKFFSGLLPRLSPLLSSLPGGDEIRQKIVSVGKEENNKLMANEFASCKSAFNRIRMLLNTRDITPVLEKLKGFNARWMSSSERVEIDNVIRFLEVIQGGPEVTLVIENGDFTVWGGFRFSLILKVYDTPDVFIEIRDGDRLLAVTPIIYDKERPNFNFPYKFTWHPNTELTFVAKDKNLFKDDEIFERTVRATGLFGYENLHGKVTDGNNSFIISLRHSIPNCPWK